MDKRKILDQFVVQMEKDLSVLTQSALATYQGAIHEDSKAEDQYDTRGLEASYLAGAQSKRISEMEERINLFKFLDLRTFGEKDKIASTALVEVEADGKRAYFFLMPKGGGIQTVFEGKTIQVVTPQSPIGEALLGKVTGSDFSVSINRTIRDYEILSIC